MKITSFKFRNHMCFRERWAGFDDLKRVNVIIGRNNVGKSHLMRLVEQLCKEKPFETRFEFKFGAEVPTDRLRSVFSEVRKVWPQDITEWEAIGARLVGCRVEWLRLLGQVATNLTIVPDPRGIFPAGSEELLKKLEITPFLVGTLPIPLSGRVFRQLAADRDIRPELASAKGPDLEPSGSGATRVVMHFKLSAKEEIDRRILDEELLSALNYIMGDEGRFSAIQCWQHEPGSRPIHKTPWEIFLTQSDRRHVALSRCGSGLKTIFLVLLNLLAVPALKAQEGSPRRDHVFVIEEPENNMHPAMLRRLLRYIEGYCRTEQAIVFVTTHSNVVLDTLGQSKDSQIIHVTQEGNSATTKTVEAHFDKIGLIAELGARPSDLLQANGIIWVEGPSDRIYLSHWIGICSEGRFKEGRDFQFAYIPGSLLAGVEFTAPNPKPEHGDAGEEQLDETGVLLDRGVNQSEADVRDLLNLLTINPNIIVVCDSDRANGNANLKARAARIEAQVNRIPNGHVWVTAGREIENYIPGTVFSRAFAKDESIPDPDRFERVVPQSRGEESYMENQIGRKSVRKVELARKLVANSSRLDMLERYDWKEQLELIVSIVASWNPQTQGAAQAYLRD